MGSLRPQLPKHRLNELALLNGGPKRQAFRVSKGVHKREFVDGVYMRASETGPTEPQLNVLCRHTMLLFFFPDADGSFETLLMMLPVIYRTAHTIDTVCLVLIYGAPNVSL